MNVKPQDDYTSAALYARVSNDRQDVDLSVAAQLRALGTSAELWHRCGKRHYDRESLPEDRTVGPKGTVWCSTPQIPRGRKGLSGSALSFRPSRCRSRRGNWRHPER